MINFTDQRLYVKGICQAIASDTTNGDILYYSNKFQTGNITTAMTMGEIRGGLGNPVATIIPSDAAVNVEFTAADFSMWAKAAQVGAKLSYNAPAMVCETVIAEGESLTIEMEAGTPCPQLGYSDTLCYVQEVGAAAPIATYGTAYALDATTGAISGFTATASKTYKVWYFTLGASNIVAELSSLFNPRVVHFTAQMPVYSNDAASSANEGSRVGWLYIIIPRLKLNGTANITGDQTGNDTTSLSGQALAFDADTISGVCTDCEAGTLAYYVYVPDDAAKDIAGLAVVGGVISMTASTSATVPVKYVMANGELVTPGTMTDLAYTLTGAPSGTSVSSAGVITAGATAGDCEISISYPATGDAEYTCVANVSVVSA